MLTLLLQYQDVDKDLFKAEQDLLNAPERKRTMMAKSFLKDSEDALMKMDRRALDLISKYEKLHETLAGAAQTAAEYEETMKSLGSEDEVLYLQKKAVQLSDTIKSVERELAAVFSDMETVGREFTEFKQKYNRAMKEYKENKEKYDALKQQSSVQTDAIAKQLAALAKKIDKTLFEKYAKKRTDKIFPILVPLHSNMCGGCKMEIFLKDISRLKSETVIECENCRRLIYNA